jgi:hypothetical protein
MLMTERNHVIDTLRATPQEAAPVTGGKGCDCGCNDPCFTEPMEALQFLSDRMKHAGISEAVGLFYARDIDAILARYPTPADESGQGREAPRAVRLAYDALLEEQAAYEEPLFHVDAAVAALEKEYPGIAPETAGRGDSTLREDAARGRAIGAEYDALIRHMDGGGDFYEFQRDAARRARGDSNG